MDAERYEELTKRLWAFMHEHIYPNEMLFQEQCEAVRSSPELWSFPPILVELKKKAKELGLWNLFLPVDTAKIAGVNTGGLTNLQYGRICEIMGTSNPAEFAAMACNCTSPDTGNMEILARFGTLEQKERYLYPLLDGTIRSCFAMTEPEVASSDASNVSISIKRDGDDYVVNGRKWWITGAGSVHCKLMILMGKTSPDAANPYKQQSMLLIPMDTPGITLLRPMATFGHIDEPKGHFEIVMTDVRVPQSCALLGEGRGFEISQARLGPGRIRELCANHSSTLACPGATCRKGGIRKSHMLARLVAQTIACV